MRGNVVDLAVGVVIGAAFGRIVTAVVDDLIMPVISLVSGGGKFTDHFVALSAGKKGETGFKTLAEAKAAGANVLAYGDLIQSVVDFMIIAFCIFMLIRVINRFQRKQEEQTDATPLPSGTDQLLMEIRDELKKGR